MMREERQCCLNVHQYNINKTNINRSGVEGTTMQTSEWNLLLDA